MRIYGLIFLLCCCFVSLQAQETQLIPVNGADTQLNVPAIIKRMWQNSGNKLNKRSAPAGGIILFQGGNKEQQLQSSRWVAAKRNQNLYYVNLAEWLNKYIGETEKNLSALLEKASAANAVLFFDEADALFGKATAGDNNEGGRDSDVAAGGFITAIRQYKSAVIISCRSKECTPLAKKENLLIIRMDKSE